MSGAEVLLRVVQAGPHVSVQDGGRPGFMRFGVPASGPMDRKALAIANIALGNPAGAAGIEVSPGGLVLECLSGAVDLALAGGGFVADLDGQRHGGWLRAQIRAGQRLAVRAGPWGNWCCLALAGQIDLPHWLGAAATHTIAGLGAGRLGPGMVLRLRDPRHGLPPRPLPCPVWARPRRRLHVVMGPQERFFPPAVQAAFLGQEFTVSAAFDRMGVRLDGPRLPPEGALGIPSEPVLRGSVQVAGDGVPAVLMADHQTTGGYPKIATVLADDLDGFAQTRPRQSLRFTALTPDQAVALTRARAARVAGWLNRLPALLDQP